MLHYNCSNVFVLQNLILLFSSRASILEPSGITKIQWMANLKKNNETSYVAAVLICPKMSGRIHSSYIIFYQIGTVEMSVGICFVYIINRCPEHP